MDLVCPVCRTLADDGALHLRTLAPAGALLACACGARFPVVDGVPIVFKDLAGYLRTQTLGVLERDLPPEVAAALAAPGPDDAPYPRLLEHASLYLDAHWGDRATPAPDGPLPPGSSELIARVAARRAHRVAAAVELGCSAGRVLAELAAGADLVVGLDREHASLRRARRLLAGEPLAYARRMIGRHYAPATASAGALAVPADRVALVCGDALDPPLVPAGFDRVVALNVVDVVADPRTLLAVVHGLCAPGGEVILSSPFAWQSHIVPDEHRLGGPDPAADLAAILTSGALGSRYSIEEQAEIPWVLRRDSRSAIAYRIHYLRARKT